MLFIASDSKSLRRALTKIMEYFLLPKAVFSIYQSHDCKCLDIKRNPAKPTLQLCLKTMSLLLLLNEL